MKYYISGHDIEEARAAAKVLRDRGSTVVSCWHDDAGPKGGWDTPDDLRLWQGRANHNEKCIQDADVLVLLAATERVPGGKFVEVGIARAHGVPVVVVGPVENGLVAGVCHRRIDRLEALP